MTPKEKAKEIYLKMIIGFVDWTYFIPMNKTDTTIFSEAKQRALIAVDEILQLCWNGNLKAQKYWMEVKQEIEKL
jgi:hypothetical protein